MSNSKSAIQEIKKLMVQFGFMAEEKVLLSFKLEDNTILQTEKLEAGNKIVMINDEFEQVALEDGSYTLVENFEIEVEDGSIVSVKEIFVNATLKDGTQVSATGKGLEVGGKLFVIKDGTSLPAPDGEHYLSDGTGITVKDGEIVSVEEPKDEAPSETAADETAEEKMATSPVEDETIKKDGKLNPQMMEEMYGLLQDFIAKCGAKMAEMEGQYNSLQNEFEAFKKEPAGEKIKYSKTENFAKIDDEVEAKVANIMSLRNNKK